ncbi:RTA1 like protein-domain-containing protein [Pseudomassariella vexata]|uniref:RTA1 like protein-domain-containing protein n=1 Tax=Pseudomassariella vexata TaxID=1141098 RepID=A0A1Y2DHZ1_9PEZI|nr:RTA1 like protein-domain-containing protein [Pseudomassariella vexata]ORY58858.1 RTA1 like protein-domain-containing protein [Pseudomassariella vexata]
MTDQNSQPFAGFKFYHYTPYMPGEVIFMIFFGLCVIAHCYQLFQYRTWYFIPFLLGCLYEFIGYIGRAISSTEAPDFTPNPYICQSLLLLLGPTLYAASIYMLLGHIIVLLEAGAYSIIPPKWLAKVFVLGDVVSLCAQVAGGGMLIMAKTQEKVESGENTILGGLGIQILFFGFFMVVTLVFHLRMHKRPTPKSQALNIPWLQLIYVLYAASILIMVRSIFRVAEYAQGQFGKLQSREVYVFVLDGLPMLIVPILLIWFHPSRIVDRDSQLVSIDSVDSVDIIEEGHMLHYRGVKNRHAFNFYPP